MHLSVSIIKAILEKTAGEKLIDESK